jgi:hypothetical protein
MVSMDMTSSQLLRPFIIFKGTFGARLMREWSTYTSSTVLFTENHWQSSATILIYLEKLRQVYAGVKAIGLVWDKASCHCSEEVLAYLNESNKTFSPRMIVEFIDAGLTSVHQPPDVVVNKPLKVEIRSQYEDMIASRARNIRFIPGELVMVSRKELVSIVEHAYKTIKNQNKSGKTFIRDSFELCGLNPWVQSTEKFQQHLDRLSENGNYKSLLEKNFDRSISS